MYFYIMFCESSSCSRRLARWVAVIVQILLIFFFNLFLQYNKVKIPYVFVFFLILPDQKHKHALINHNPIYGRLFLNQKCK